MSRKIGNVVILEPEEGVCELCGKKADTRPYGPHGERVCFECGMKNEEAATKAFLKRFGMKDENDQKN